MSKRMSTQNTGNIGEGLAARYLEQHGYDIVRKNYRYGHGEIDLIVQKENVLIFVEVKTKKHGNFGDPITWVRYAYRGSWSGTTVSGSRQPVSTVF